MRNKMFIKIAQSPHLAYVGITAIREICKIFVRCSVTSRSLRINTIQRSWNTGEINHTRKKRRILIQQIIYKHRCYLLREYIGMRMPEVIDLYSIYV